MHQVVNQLSLSLPVVIELVMVLQQHIAEVNPNEDFQNTLAHMVLQVANLSDLDKKAIRCLSHALKGQVPEYLSAFVFLYKDEVLYISSDSRDLIDSFDLSVFRTFSNATDIYLYLMGNLILESQHNPAQYAQRVESMGEADIVVTKGAFYGLLPKHYRGLFQTLEGVAEHCGVPLQDLLNDFLARYVRSTARICLDDKGSIVRAFIEGARCFLAFTDQDWEAWNDILSRSEDLDGISEGLSNPSVVARFGGFVGIYLQAVDDRVRMAYSVSRYGGELGQADSEALSELMRLIKPEAESSFNLT